MRDASRTDTQCNVRVCETIRSVITEIVGMNVGSHSLAPVQCDSCAITAHLSSVRSLQHESRWVKRYIMCPWPVAHGAHTCAGLPMQIPQERACHPPDMTHQPQGAGGRARTDDGAAAMRDASRTDTQCNVRVCKTIRSVITEIVGMLDLTPSLQYNVIAALSPPLVQVA